MALQQREIIGFSWSTTGETHVTHRGDCYTRHHVAHGKFYHIARSQLLQARFLEAEIANDPKDIFLDSSRGRDFEYMSELTHALSRKSVFETMIEESCAVAVIFSALAVEAMINAYGILHFSKAYYTKYLDKLDIIAKWVIVPKLAGSPALELGHQPMQRLTALKRLRDRLVHFKASIHEHVAGEKVEAEDNSPDAWSDVTLKDAEDAVACVRELADLLDGQFAKSDLKWLDSKDVDLRANATNPAIVSALNTYLVDIGKPFTREWHEELLSRRPDPPFRYCDDPDAFARTIDGETKTPEYSHGDVIVFSPKERVLDGDDCLVRLHDGSEIFGRVETGLAPNSTEIMIAQPDLPANASNVPLRDVKDVTRAVLRRNGDKWFSIERSDSQNRG